MEIKTTTQGKCGKCSGRGRIDAFTGTANGVCFDCGGAGSLSYASRTAGWTRTKIIARLADWFTSRDMVCNWGDDAATAIADLICRAPADVYERALAAAPSKLPAAVAVEVIRCAKMWRPGYQARGESLADLAVAQYRSCGLIAGEF